MGERQSVEALQWLAYIGQRRDDMIHARNGREVNLPGVPNVKVDGYSSKTKVFEYLGCFRHGCPCMPNRHKPIGTTEETLLTKYEGKKAGGKKIKNAGYTVSIRGCEFRKLLRENPGLENERTLHPYLKNSPLNIWDALNEGRTEATKTYYRVKQGEKINYVDAISLTPIFVNMASFL